MKVQVAQSVKHQARNLKVVGSSPTVDKNFLFCILSLLSSYWQVGCSHTKEIKHDIRPRSKVHRENDHLKEKMVAVLVPITR